MKTNGKHEVIARIAGTGLVLAALFAMVFSSSIAGRAQTSATTPAVPAATPAKAAPASQPSQATAPGKRQPGGNHEGITIHGHWTIEVRNPDGKLVTHREFENGLSTIPGNGASLLSALLSHLIVGGSWAVYLEDPTQAHGIQIAEANSQAYTSCVNLDAQNGFFACSTTPLSLVGPIIAANQLVSVSTFTLEGSGTVPASFPGTIGFVSTVTFPCGSNLSISQCYTSGGIFGNGLTFTSRTLDGLNGDPVAVPVTAGQAVAVTVVISFQ